MLAKQYEMLQNKKFEITEDTFIGLLFFQLYHFDRLQVSHAAAACLECRRAASRIISAKQCETLRNHAKQYETLRIKAKRYGEWQNAPLLTDIARVHSLLIFQVLEGKMVTWNLQKC